MFNLQFSCGCLMRLLALLKIIQQMSMARDKKLFSSKDVFCLFIRPAIDAMYYWFNVTVGLYFNIPLPGIAGKKSFPVDDLQPLVNLHFLCTLSRVTPKIIWVDSCVVF